MKRFLVSVLLGAILAFTQANDSVAAGTEPYLSEITVFAGRYAPRGYAFCDGRRLPITQNQALYALVGSEYGGDGRTYFNLPDLREAESKLNGARYIIAVSGLYPPSN